MSLAVGCKTNILLLWHLLQILRKEFHNYQQWQILVHHQGVLFNFRNIKKRNAVLVWCDEGMGIKCEIGNWSTHKIKSGGLFNHTHMNNLKGSCHLKCVSQVRLVAKVNKIKCLRNTFVSWPIGLCRLIEILDLYSVRKYEVWV